MISSSWRFFLEVIMFEKTEIDTELHARLKATGFNPLDPQVQSINAVVSGCAEKTAKVLQQVQEVLNRRGISGWC
jgi:hypothetical protein